MTRVKIEWGRTSQNCSFSPLMSTQYCSMYERVSLAPWLVKRVEMSVYARDGSQLSV